MKIKNFILYNIKKNINNFCKKCNLCIFLCPKKKILIKKKYLIKKCNFCNYCKINCISLSIK